MNIDELLSKTLSLETNWIIVAVISGLLSALGAIAYSLFKKCLSMLEPREAVQRLLDAMKDPDQWVACSREGIHNFKHKIHNISLGQDSEGYVCRVMLTTDLGVSLLSGMSYWERIKILNAADRVARAVSRRVNNEYITAATNNLVAPKAIKAAVIEQPHAPQWMA